MEAGHTRLGGGLRGAQRKRARRIGKRGREVLLRVLRAIEVVHRDRQQVQVLLMINRPCFVTFFQD